MEQTSTGVPFLDLGPAHAPVREPVLAAIEELFETGGFTNGPAVAEFERAFADYCGVEHCVGVSSGLDALRLALVATGLEPGDEVVVPAATFVATLEAVTQAGGVPVVVDVSDQDYCLDADAARSAIGPRTHSLMPVHLYGQMADMQALLRAAGTSVAIVEDACQAHGAERDGLRAGAVGAAAAFSFYPGKNLGAYGDAGAVTTDDDDLADRIRLLRDLGQRAKYEHVVVGRNERLDTLQAAVLRVKLRHLDEWNERRRAHAALYSELLDDAVEVPSAADWAQPVWHLYVVRTARRDEVRDALAQAGIASGMHYPVPLHLQPALASLGYREGDFPCAEDWARSGLSLPMFPELTAEEVERVSAVIRRVAGRVPV